MAGTVLSSDYGYLRRLVLDRSHNVLDPSRNFLFDVKLERLVRNRGLDGLHELVERMRRGHDEQLESAVADAMTVNETSFFRDTRPFELLRTELLPELIAARGATRALRLWSAACSTGQEPYSLAMLIREHFSMLAGWRIRIEGTDLCKEVLERAKAASYERIEVNRGLPARCLAKYFDRTGEHWTVKPEIRSMCSFRQMNLADTPVPFSERFDVILMRNVMLYFGPDTRSAVMAEVHRLLVPDGVLIMGATEQPAEKALWKATITGGACYFRPVAA
ncbi:MAG TPA: protein-glutamate O-methyltransferase CheR [Terracidiphilus sp.]|nr:protein-glutamate O-methyltransferase CheR [Terracidiphilus sp.]